jgi:hypothetical protein
MSDLLLKMISIVCLSTDTLTRQIMNRLMSGRLVGSSRTEQAQEVEGFKKHNKVGHILETHWKFMFRWLTYWFVCVPLNKSHIKKMCFIKSISFFVWVCHKQKFRVKRFCSLKKVEIVIELVWQFGFLCSKYLRKHFYHKCWWWISFAFQIQTPSI